MTSESQAIPQSVVDAVKGEHPARLSYEVDDAIAKARGRIAGVKQGQEAGEGQVLSVHEALVQTELGLDALMTATCEREATALVALDALINELTQQSDPDDELGILKSLRSHLQEAEVQHKREALGSLEQQELAQHFKRCLRLQFAQLMRGDSAPSSFYGLEKTVRDIEEALANAWAMEPTQYADVKQAKGSYAYAIARVNVGQSGRTPEVLEVYREVAKEFILGVFRRWVDGKPTTVERNLNQTSRTDKPKREEKVTIEPTIVTEPKKALVIAAVAEMVETIINQMPVSPDAFHSAWRRTGTNGDPVVGATMEAVSGFFFDGFGGGFGDESGRQKVDTFAQGEEDKSAYYRGAIIRSLIDGAGSTHMYVDAVTHLTPIDTIAVAKVAARLMREIPPGSEDARDRIAVFIMTLPADTVPSGDRDYARLHGESQYQNEMRNMVESISAQSAQKVGEAIARATYLYQTDMKTLAVEMSDPYEGTRDRAYVHVVRRMALANVAETIVRDSVAQLVVLNHSPAEILAASKAVQELKPPFTDRTPATPPSLADSLSWKLAFATELLDPQVMVTHAPNISKKMSERFTSAPKYGVTRAELVIIHNRVAATVAELNSHLDDRKGRDWTKAHGMSFTDVMGALGPDVTGAFYSVKTLAHAPGVRRVTDPRTYEKADGTVAMYLVDPNTRPPEGYVDSFRPPGTLLADADTLDAARAQLQDRSVEQKFLRLVEARALRSDIVEKSPPALYRVRDEAPVPPGYEDLIAQAEKVTQALGRIVAELPNIPGSISSTDEAVLRGYFDSSNFPDSGMGAGAKRGNAKRAVQRYVKDTYGVEIGDFADRSDRDLNSAFWTSYNQINDALAQKKAQAWLEYQKKLNLYTQHLESAMSSITAKSEDFARKAIEKYWVTDEKTSMVEGVRNTIHVVKGFKLTELGADGKQITSEVDLRVLGKKETGDLNVIAKIAREYCEAYAAFLRPIAESFSQAQDRAQQAGDTSYGGGEFRRTVLLPVWQKLVPEGFRFEPPKSDLESFTQVLQPYLENYAKTLTAERANAPNPIDSLTKTDSVVTRTVGNMLQ
jgi:hypothetical protein